MTYQQRLNKHLAEYKRSTLRIVEKGVYFHRGTKHLYDHILPTKALWLNVLEPFRDPLHSFFGKNPRLKRHRYFHHLNSSQAFAFNLFFPYFQGDTASAAVLLRALGQTASFKSWEPESIPVSAEETNVDVVWKTDDGITTFCEIKLSEASFGTASEDERHLKKLRTTYGPSLTPYVDPGLLTPRRFFRSYQILRNLWQLTGSQRSVLVFLMPRANERLWRELDVVLSGVADELRRRVSRIATEDVIARLCDARDCPAALAGYAEQLRAKYLLLETA